MTERGCPSVPPPNWEPIAHSAIFDDNGKPRPDVIKAHFEREGLLSESDALDIIMHCALIWKNEPNVVHLDDPVVVCGDIHGQFYDLLTLLEVGGDPAHQNYVFLGDYVDRGCFGMEVILLLMSYKILFPRTLVMLRGNHESRHLTSYFNFKIEVMYKYSLAVYNSIMSAFDCLPLACVVSNKFFCVHGGLSQELLHIRDIDAIHRFREPPSSGSMCDMLWADPMHDDREMNTLKEQLFVPNTTRGCSYVYSHEAACRFLEANQLVAIIRGHEAQGEGYLLYRHSQNSFPAIICVFSAPNYCDTYDNRAAVVALNKNIMSLRQYNSRPHPYYLPNYINAFSWSLPFVADKMLDIWSHLLCTESEDYDDEVGPGVEQAAREDRHGDADAVALCPAVATVCTEDIPTRTQNDASCDERHDAHMTHHDTDTAELYNQTRCDLGSDQLGAEERACMVKRTEDTIRHKVNMLTNFTRQMSR